MKEIKLIPVPPSIIKEKWNIKKQCWEEGITEEERIFLYKKEIEKLENVYIVEKMKIENVFNDFMSYMDEKTSYNNHQKQLEIDKELAYQEMLKENPELTYEEFMSIQPMTLNLVEEPQPSQALQKFMEKYL